MVSRDELYRLVWSEPMTKIAERFDVSGSYLARVCTLLNVPRPERGYWAKLEVGKAPPAENRTKKSKSPNREKVALKAGQTKLQRVEMMLKRIISKSFCIIGSRADSLFDLAGRAMGAAAHPIL